MAITALKDLRKRSENKPPRILIYGPPGIGKTTLASEFPNPVFLQLEDGAPPKLEWEGWEQDELQSFGDIIDAMEMLEREHHIFDTLVIDSVTQMQRLVFDETCQRGDEKGNTKSNIEDFGYGKGYVKAQAVMQEFIDAVNALRRRGISTVLLAHSKIERFDDPESVSYDRYEIDLHSKIVGAIEQDMDAILLLKKPVTIKESDEGFNKKRARADGPSDRVMIHTTGKPAFVAKNRFDMPSEIQFKLGHGFEALARYLAPGGASVADDQPAQDATPEAAPKRGARGRGAA